MKRRKFPFKLNVLCCRQALNDIAEFVQQMNQQHNFTGPWITFGCSYAGSLATWMRYLFPHLIQGSIADSAPVEAADVNTWKSSGMTPTHIMVQKKLMLKMLSL